MPGEGQGEMGKRMRNEWLEGQCSTAAVETLPFQFTRNIYHELLKKGSYCGNIHSQSLK